MKALTYIEIDLPFCSRIYGEAPCAAKLEGGFYAVAHDWNFAGTLDGWVGNSGASLTSEADGAVLQTTGANPVAQSPSALSISGADNPLVEIDCERVTEGGTVDGRFYYTTAGHGYSNSFYKDISALVPTVPGERIKFVIDMRELTVGGTDWTDSSIKRLRIDFDLGGSGAVKLYSVRVGTSYTAEEATGTKKCFNTRRTCQDRENFNNVPVTVRYAVPTDYLPRSIDAIPSIQSIALNPGTISLGRDLGQRATLTVAFRDHRHSDTGPGGDPYRSERGYDPFSRGTYWGKFRARHPFVQGLPIRVIRGLLGQELADMDVSHYVVESFDGPSPDGVFTLTAKDVLKLADNDRAQAPNLSNGFLQANISSGATSLTLSPSGIGDAEYPEQGAVAIGGKEIALFVRSIGPDEFTSALYHFDGTNGSTTFTDSSGNGHSLTAVNNAQISTAQSKFGGASATFDGTNDSLTGNGSADFAFGSGDFTIELFFRLTTLGSVRVLYDSRPNATNGAYPTLRLNASNVLEYFTNSAAQITGTTAIVAATWYHVAVSRKDGVTRLWLDGVQEGASFADSSVYLNGASRPIFGEAGNDGTGDFVGFIDECRITKGLGRYFTTFVAPAFPFDGANPDVLTLIRGQLGTTAQAHSAGDRAQLCLRYVAEDPADIVADLLTNYAAVPSGQVPVDDWRTETGTFLQRVYTATIAEPVGVNALISELVEQAALALWWDPDEQEIRLQVLRGISTDAARFSPSNILEGSLRTREQPDKRLSQVWTYFGQINPLRPVDESDNYRSAAATVDLQAQSDYGAPAIKKIFSRWIPEGGRSVALRLNDLVLGRYRDPPRRFSFELFRRGADVPLLGGGYRVEAWTIQDDTGALDDAPVQITRLNADADRYQIEAEEALFTQFDETDLLNRVIIIDVPTNNANLRTLHDALYPVIDDPTGITVTLIIEEGVTVGSANTSLNALEIGSWPVGLDIVVKPKGRIQGAGGRGGRVQSAAVREAGQVGGPALYTRYPITLDLTEGAGEVWGGGGGGGAGGGDILLAGGGGGGAGTVAGAAGTGGTGSNNGQAGTATAGGTGGGPVGNKGGNGGGPGLSGASGAGSTPSAAAGGAAGAAIDGVSYVTISGTGDVRGSQIN